jgi:hypothetical protein
MLGMRPQAQLHINFYTRVDPDTDARRRRLQERTGLSAPRLVKAALIELERVLAQNPPAPEASP